MATRERGIRSYLDGEVSLQLPVSRTLVPSNAGSRASRNGTLRLIACSRCLRVLRDQQWVLAETVIRELRSFENEAPPRFEPVVCPICALSIQLRRGRARVPLGTDMARARGPR